MRAPEYPWLETSWQQLLQQSEQGQAFLIHGQAGLGKQQLAESLVAHWLGTQKPLTGGDLVHADLIYIDGAQGIKIDQVRSACSQLAQTAHDGQGKVLLMTQAEQMSESAANALLKTLEEPAGSTRIVLTSNRFAELLPTIRSRCLSVAVSMPATEHSAQWLHQRHPSQPGDAIQQALLFSSGAPLLAEQMLSADTLDKARQLISHLEKLQRSPAHLALMVEWLVTHDQQGIQWLLAIAYEGMRQVTGRSSRLAKLPVAFPLKHWLRLIDECQTLLSQLRQSPGLNLSLQLSKLLQAWRSV